MIRHRGVVLGLAVLVAVSLATGTGSISSTVMDRGLDGSVVGDDRAYLGVAQIATNSTTNTTDLEIVVTNRLASTLGPVSVTVATETVVIGGIPPGESVSAEFTAVDCGAPVTVDADGTVVAISLKRAVDCS